MIKFKDEYRQKGVFFTMKKLFPFLLVLLVLLISILACNLPSTSSSTPTEIPVSSQAVEQAKEQVKSAIATVQSGGDIEMQFTEDQLTSLAAEELAKYAEADISNIQVGLQDGQIIISARARQSGFDLPAKIAIAIKTDGQGGLDFQIISATIGPLPVPESMLNELTSQLEIGLREQMVTNDVYIDDVSIADGLLIIKGHLR
jgi:uncharacterized protein YpmS